MYLYKFLDEERLEIALNNCICLFVVVVIVIFIYFFKEKSCFAFLAETILITCEFELCIVLVLNLLSYLLK